MENAKPQGPQGSSGAGRMHVTGVLREMKQAMARKCRALGLLADAIDCAIKHGVIDDEQEACLWSFIIQIGGR